MLLYHYSKKKHSHLKTLELQKAILKEEKEKDIQANEWFANTYGVELPGKYFQHISFFFEPIPLNIYEYFPVDHSVWVKGNELYEHVVELKPSDIFGYRIVEFPEKTELYINDTLSDDEYHREMKKLYNQKPYIRKHGLNYKTFSDFVKKEGYVGLTEKYYKLLKSRSNYDDLKQKYAATVPHVMLYPSSGLMKVKECKKIFLTKKEIIKPAKENFIISLW